VTNYLTPFVIPVCLRVRSPVPLSTVRGTGGHFGDTSGIAGRVLTNYAASVKTNYDRISVRLTPEKLDNRGIKLEHETEDWLELWENYREELNLPIFKVILGFK